MKKHEYLDILGDICKIFRIFSELNIFILLLTLIYGISSRYFTDKQRYLVDIIQILFRYFRIFSDIFRYCQEQKQQLVEQEVGQGVEKEVIEQTLEQEIGQETVGQETVGQETVEQSTKSQQNEFVLLEGNRIVNLPLAGDWLVNNTVCSLCKQGIFRPINETKFGLASTIEWKCDHCETVSHLKTSPKQNKQHEINTRMVTALKTSSPGGSYKVYETLTTHLDISGTTKRIFSQDHLP